MGTRSGRERDQARSLELLAPAVPDLADRDRIEVVQLLVPAPLVVIADGPRG